VRTHASCGSLAIYQSLVGSLCPKLGLSILFHSPFPLLPQAPHDDVAPSSAIVVPVRVEAAPALFVARAVEDGVHCWLEVFEEDEIFGPGSASAVVDIVPVLVGWSGASW